MTIPPGYVLVPLEATNAMIYAAGVPENNVALKALWPAMMRETWRLMLAAAPDLSMLSKGEGIEGEGSDEA